MAHLYFLHNRLQAAPAGTPIDADQPVVEVLNSLEIGEACFLSSETRESLRSIYTVENTYLDVFPHCLIGSFAVPNKNHILFDPPRIWCSSTTAPPARAFSRKSPRKAF